MNMKKLIALLLTLVMLVSLAACGGGGSNNDNDDVQPGGTGLEEVTFPLAEQKEFTIIMTNDDDWDEDLANNPLWQDLQTSTNVKINIKRIPRSEAMTSLNNLLLTKEPWDGMFTSFMSDGEYSTLAGSGFFMDVKDIITNEKICPNFVNRSLVGRESTALNALTTPNGGVYGLSGGNMLEGSGLESPILVNKDWVEQAGMEVEDIKTIEDLETLLAYWSENDMNGNGKQDEIPFLMYQNNSQRHMEAMLGLYGISTKDGTYENYVTVVDGEVQFVPLLDAWKDCVKKMAEWYANGYIWSDVFSGNSVNTYFWDTILASPIPIVGMMTAASCGNTDLADQYVQIPPVTVEGYEPVWYNHPGQMNPKAAIAVSKTCKDPEILLAWFDQFLTLENSLRFQYGEEGEGWEYTADGKISILELSYSEDQRLREDSPSLYHITAAGVTLPSCFTAADYEEKIELNDDQLFQIESYEMYEEYFVEEPWPRPYFSVEQSEELAKIRTDIFNLVNLKRAEWVTGASNIDVQYDQFVKDLERMGVDRLTEIMQDAYDNYIGK
ncbi:MAG: hypothetical protein IJW41_00515 [Oscillospiraceae bacterium]|nr:hypothetical protein [Oscillospiraceae bacterium]